MYSFKYNQQDATLYIFFLIVNAVHVSGSFSAHHEELKNCTHSIWYTETTHTVYNNGEESRFRTVF